MLGEPVLPEHLPEVVEVELFLQLVFSPFRVPLAELAQKEL